MSSVTTAQHDLAELVDGQAEVDGDQLVAAAGEEGLRRVQE